MRLGALAGFKEAVDKLGMKQVVKNEGVCAKFVETQNGCMYWNKGMCALRTGTYDPKKCEFNRRGLKLCFVVEMKK